MQVRLKTKYCSALKHWVPTVFFGKNNSKSDGLQINCKPCRKLINQRYYVSSKTTQNPKRYERKAQIVASNRLRLVEYFKTHPCVDCGNSDLRVLQSDHRDPELKSANISHLVRNNHRWETILIELNKCDTRCANCHQIKTGEQFGWWWSKA
jgi:hypothetical protein